MVDFKKLRQSKSQAIVIDPKEIFRRLPKPEGINDLYISQGEVLDQWFERRGEKDIVIKLHTGGGKTLVGLLIAQSIMNEKGKPVVYLCPNNQLVQQTLVKAEEYGISAVQYEKGSYFSDEFLEGRSVLICNYQALFNGLSRFGTKGGHKTIIEAGAIILDDSHVALSALRQGFTFRVDKDGHPECYSYLCSVFRKDFIDLDKVGTFDDVVEGAEFSVLEIPYWSWRERSQQIRDYLKGNLDLSSDEFAFIWPLLRDNFDHCHALIGPKSFVITPIFPLVDLIPTFQECSHRVFMSATITDDSAIVKTFDADPDSVMKPITSNSLTGVSERMIIVPELMRKSSEDIVSSVPAFTKYIVEKKGMATVVLTPGDYAVKQWSEVAEYADTSKKVSSFIEKLQAGKSRGPFVFANRYDGIDLPGTACRILIVDGCPRGLDEYDLFRASVFSGGAELNGFLAQRIEQAIGRGARGPRDYCVVILMGKDLVSWISLSSNLKYLTTSTRAQLEMGSEVSRDVKNKNDFLMTVMSCLDRDRDWIEYHAETLAELDNPTEIASEPILQAAGERKMFRLYRDGYYEKAINLVKILTEKSTNIDSKNKSWLLQQAARVANRLGNEEISLNLQKEAYALNHNILRPRTAPSYQRLTIPGIQAEAISKEIFAYKYRLGYIAKFDEVVSLLNHSVSSNQFEQSFSDLGHMLGFSTERPDNVYKIGPDILWIMKDKLALVVEAKSRKENKNALTKKQHGQILEASEWFETNYPELVYQRVIISPNAVATKSATITKTLALTYDGLNKMIVDTRKLLTQLCNSMAPFEELVLLCEKLLRVSSLTPEDIVKTYLEPFKNE